MEFNNNNNAFTDPSLLQCIHDWLDIHVPPYHLFPMWLYYPLSSNVQVDEEDWKIRNEILQGYLMKNTHMQFLRLHKKLYLP